MAIILENQLEKMLGVDAYEDFEFCGYIDGTDAKTGGGEAALTPKAGRNPPYSMTLYPPNEQTLTIPDNNDYKFVVQVSKKKVT